MPRLITIDLDRLGAGNEAIVRGMWRMVAKQEDYVMTLKEAADLYGYQYHTVRSYVKSGRLKTGGKSVVTGRAGLSHAEMRRYLQALRKTSQRKAFRVAQVRIAVDPTITSIPSTRAAKGTGLTAEVLIGAHLGKMREEADAQAALQKKGKMDRFVAGPPRDDERKN